MKRRARRGGDSSVARQIAADVETLSEILAAEARRLPLTVGEARMLRDAAAPMPTASGAGRLLFGALLDTIDAASESGIDAQARYDVDPEQLTRKLRSAGVAADVAIRDALAEWRIARLPDTADGYRSAGLNVIEEEGS
jgi:hypothetical protein